MLGSRGVLPVLYRNSQVLSLSSSDLKQWAEIMKCVRKGGGGRRGMQFGAQHSTQGAQGWVTLCLKPKEGKVLQ